VIIICAIVKAAIVFEYPTVFGGFSADKMRWRIRL